MSDLTERAAAVETAARALFPPMLPPAHVHGGPSAEVDFVEAVAAFCSALAEAMDRLQEQVTRLEAAVFAAPPEWRPR